MASAAQILLLADRYAVASKVPLVTVSSRVFDDSKKLAAIRGGADLTLRRFNAAVLWFSENWPEGVPWPTDVQRPAPSERSGAAA